MIGSVTQVQQDMAAIDKRRKNRGERAGRDMRGEEARGPTGAHDAARAELDAMDGEHARKAMPGTRPRGPHATEPGTGEPGPENTRGARPGPGDFARPDGIAPQDFRRGYLDSGHSAPSPQSGPPQDFPVPQGQPAPQDYQRGYIEAGHATESPRECRRPAAAGAVTGRAGHRHRARGRPARRVAGPAVHDKPVAARRPVTPEET